MTSIAQNSFEIFYDNYSPMVYGMALQFSPVNEKTEEIVIATFREAFKSSLDLCKYPSSCITLIHILLHKVQVLLKDKTNLKFNLFENSDLLYHLFCKQA